MVKLLTKHEQHYIGKVTNIYFTMGTDRAVFDTNT